MNKLKIVLIALTTLSLLLISCEESITEKSTEGGEAIALTVTGSYSSIGGAWNAAPCPNESWDGDPLEDCYGSPDNCIVACSDVNLSPEYTNFQYNIDNGNSADYYENGNGQTFLPLKTGPYNDLINGDKIIVRVPAGQDEYALVDAAN